MIPFTHPILRDYLAAARKQPCDNVMARTVLYDRLAEATGHFAGEEGGVTLADACWWYARGADEDEPALREALATLDEMTPASVQQVKDQGDRPTRVRAMSEDSRLFVHLALNDEGTQEALGAAAGTGSAERMWSGLTRIPNLADAHPKVKAAGKRAKAAVCRDLRRRVLALYSEVVYKRELKLDLSQCRSANEVTLRIREAESKLREGDWPVHADVKSISDDLKRVITWRQTLSAPDMIPPAF